MTSITSSSFGLMPETIKAIAKPMPLSACAGELGENSGQKTLQTLLPPEILSIKRREWENLDNPRLPSSGQKLYSHLRKGNKLTQSDKIFISRRLNPILRFVSKGKKALKKFLEFQPRFLLSVVKLWRGIDTCLALAFPSETKQTTIFKGKWWSRIVNLCVGRETVHFAIKDWKNFVKYLYLYFGGSVSPIPVWNKDWPKLPEGTWLCKSPGTLTDEEYAHWSLLRSTRMLPSGDKVAEEEALEKHYLALCRSKEPPLEDLERLDYYSRIAAESINRQIPDKVWDKRSGHISISNSACYEASRSEGGRRRYVLEHLREWLDSEPNEDRITYLPFGDYVIEKAGITRSVTVHPSHMADGIGKRMKVSSGMFTEDFPDSEQERVGFQLFAWSFIYLMENNFLTAKGYPTGKPLPVTRKSIPEPGWKVRIVTKSLAAFVTYGQPYAHIMREILSHDPALKAGLGAGAQAWEWLKRLNMVQNRVPGYIMVGDFESSTDHINHTSGRVAMQALHETLGINNAYIEGYMQLLLSPRLLEVDDIRSDLTSSGALMGEPGTKIVLTFLAKVANVAAHNGRTSFYFATAGDDQIDSGDDPEPLKLYAEATRITTMIPSLDKWGVMAYAADYCQQTIVSNRNPLRSEIGVPKGRLLSPETKQGRGDNETNPAFGKATALRREFAYKPDDFKEIKRKMLLMFLKNMNEYICYSSELFLPPEWGGLGLPGLRPEQFWQSIPEWKRLAIHRREQGCEKTRRVLARWNTVRNFTRGIDLEEGSAEEAYRDLIYSSLEVVSDYREVLKDLAPGTRFQEVKNLMKDEGFMPLNEFIRQIISSQQYQEYWSVTYKADRGYKSLTWKQRSRRMEKALSQLDDPIQCDIEQCPGMPQWHPESWVNTLGMFPHLIEDTNTSELLPVIGPGLTGPRVFLHYQNRLLVSTRSTGERA